MKCPDCGGDTYDNRQRKAKGEMKRNAPDFKCKDKGGCGWVQWPEKKPEQRNGGEPKPTNGRAPYTWLEMYHVFSKCHEMAKRVYGEKSPDLHAGTSTLFIQATRMGLKVGNAKPVREEFEEMPAALQAEDDDLPF